MLNVIQLYFALYFYPPIVHIIIFQYNTGFNYIFPFSNLGEES